MKHVLTILAILFSFSCKSQDTSSVKKTEDKNYLSYSNQEIPGPRKKNKNKSKKLTAIAIVVWTIGAAAIIIADKSTIGGSLTP